MVRMSVGVSVGVRGRGREVLHFTTKTECKKLRWRGKRVGWKEIGLIVRTRIDMTSSKTEREIERLRLSEKWMERWMDEWGRRKRRLNVSMISTDCLALQKIRVVSCKL